MKIKPKKGFSKVPLTAEKKERLADKFIESAGKIPEIDNSKRKSLGKTKPLYLRAPQSYHDDLQEIMKLTGLSMNAVCLELLRHGIKEKLKELKEDM